MFKNFVNSRKTYKIVFVIKLKITEISNFVYFCTIKRHIEFLFYAFFLFLMSYFIFFLIFFNKNISLYSQKSIILIVILQIIKLQKLYFNFINERSLYE